MNPKINNFLLTGEPGIGITPIIMEVLSGIKVKAGGFVTQEIRSGKTRKGYQLMTLNGQQAVLAGVNKKSTYKVGGYGVDIEVMTQLAVPALQDALASSDLIVIDEIGKMECFSKEFRDITMRCLDSEKPVLGSIQSFASPFINTVTNREDVAVIVVDQINRNDMSINIQVLMEQLFSDRKPPVSRMTGKPARCR